MEIAASTRGDVKAHKVWSFLNKKLFKSRAELQVEMSEDDPNNHAELVPVEHGLALTSLADNRIVSEMVADSLVLARDSAPARVDLDALVREAKALLLGPFSR